MKSETNKPASIRVARPKPAVQTGVRAGALYLHNPRGSNNGSGG